MTFAPPRGKETRFSFQGNKMTIHFMGKERLVDFGRKEWDDLDFNISSKGALLLKEDAKFKSILSSKNMQVDSNFFASDINLHIKLTM